MKSAANKRSIVLDGRKTSISLDDSLWVELKEIAQFKRVSVAKLIAVIDATRKQSNLSSEIRIFVLEHFRKKRKQVDLPYSDRATASSDEGRSTQAWHGFARRA
jgi:predicted DNA-binding ribbon-helix-helix protein